MKVVTMISWPVEAMILFDRRKTIAACRTKPVDIAWNTRIKYLLGIEICKNLDPNEVEACKRIEWRISYMRYVISVDNFSSFEQRSHS